MPLEIKEPVGVRAFNDDSDVRFIKTVLNRLGYYYPDPEKGISGEGDSEFFNAIKNFQRTNFLSVDGKIQPNDKVMDVLKEELDNPDNFMLFKGHYIWRTVGDDDVRSAHAVRNGRQFSWDNAPEGGHPGEGFGCRCWAEPVIPMTPKGVNVGFLDLLNAEELDAIQSSVSPLDVLGSGIAVIKGGKVLLTNSIARENGKLVFKTGREFVGSSARLLTSRFRDTKWIDKTPKSQFQSKFKHAKKFGIKGNQNNKSLNKYREVLKKHVKDNDTIIIKGSYHKKSMTHYYNPKTGNNVMRNNGGNLRSAWELTKEQKLHMLRNGKLGGNKK